jgi:hypothetical protein
MDSLRKLHNEKGLRGIEVTDLGGLRPSRFASGARLEPPSARLALNLLPLYEADALL